MKTQIGEVILRSKRFEAILKTDFGAIGGGLSELTRSVDSRLPYDLKRRLLSIAQMRNAIAHDQRINCIKDIDFFISVINSIENGFKAINPNHTISYISKSDMEPEVIYRDRPTGVVSKEVIKESPIPGPSIKEMIEIYQIPNSIIWGCGLIVLAFLWAILGGGFVHSFTYPVEEPIKRWWWFDGVRTVIKAGSEWMFPMYLLSAGGITCTWGVFSHFIKKK